MVGTIPFGREGIGEPNRRPVLKKEGPSLEVDAAHTQSPHSGAHVGVGRSPGRKWPMALIAVSRSLGTGPCHADT